MGTRLMLKTRHVQFSHLDEVKRLGHLMLGESRFTDTKLDEEQWCSLVNTSLQSAHFFFQVLTDGVKCKGFIQAAIQPNPFSTEIFCAIHSIFVEKEYRGQGYAEEFLINVKDWATKNNCYEVIAGDFGFQPRATGRWYARQGYTTVGQQYAIKI